MERSFINITNVVVLFMLLSDGVLSRLFLSLVLYVGLLHYTSRKCMSSLPSHVSLTLGTPSAPLVTGHLSPVLEMHMYTNTIFKS